MNYEKITDTINKIKSIEGIKNYKKQELIQSVVGRLLFNSGWDIFNKNEVLPNYVIGRIKVTYYLKSDVNNLLLEVKSPESTLEEDAEDFVDVMARCDATMGILTNGIEWRFYLSKNSLMRDTAFANMFNGYPQPTLTAGELKFAAFDLLLDESGKISKYLNDFLSKDSVASTDAKKKAEQILFDRLKSSRMLYKTWDRLIRDSDENLIDLLAKKTDVFFGIRPEPNEILFFLRSLSEMIKKKERKSNRRRGFERRRLSGTNTEKVYKAVESSDGPIDTEGISMITGFSHNNIRAILSRLRKQNKIRRVGVGLYQVPK
ncbi:MAG: hypothetical protein U5R49_12840 [Deltaproteobacteria bacterium]|nr:hypothetical protein [Deltaproteobacteria bacterium]